MQNRQLFTKAQWRALVLFLAVATALADIWALAYVGRSTNPETAGTLGVKWGAQEPDYYFAVEALRPESPLALAGAQIGDRVHMDHYADRRRPLDVDETVGLTLLSGGTSRHLTVKPMPNPDIAASPVTAAVFAATNWVVMLVALLLAFLIGWYRAETTPMRALSWVLFCVCSWGYADAVPGGWFLDVSLRMLRPILFFSLYSGLLFLALRIPEENPLWRQRAVRIGFYGFISLYALINFGLMMQRYELLSPTLFTLLNKIDYGRNLTFASIALGLWALWTSWHRNNGDARRRVGWIGGFMTIVYFAYVWIFFSPLLPAAIPPVVRVATVNLVQVIGFCVLAYAIFRHRLFDFSFVVNRALVFTIISSFLLIVFSMTEFAVDKLLHFEGREKNVIFDAAVALAIILSFHRIQHWVSHRVDHTFFHHWYAAAEKLRLFMARAAHIAEARTLQDKYLDAMKQFCGAPDLVQYLRGADHAYHRTHGDQATAATLAVDSDLAIALRHRRGTVDLRSEDFKVPGDYAFPMTLRGDVQGIIILMPKSDGGAYRPDEIKLLAESVSHYALDLESLRVEELEREMQALRLSNRDLNGTVTALREAMVAQLRVQPQPHAAD